MIERRFNVEKAAILAGYGDNVRMFRFLTELGAILPSPESRRKGKGYVKTFTIPEIRIASILREAQPFLLPAQRVEVGDFLRLNYRSIEIAALNPRGEFLAIKGSEAGWHAGFRSATAEGFVPLGSFNEPPFAPIILVSLHSALATTFSDEIIDAVLAEPVAKGDAPEARD